MQLEHLYDAQIGTEDLYKRLVMKGISIEMGYLYLLYDQGTISVDIYQYQRNLLDQQMDAARHKYKQPANAYASRHWIKDKLSVLVHGKRDAVSFQYDLAWSRLLSSEFTMAELEQELDDQEMDELIKEHVLSIWQSWHQHSEDIIHQLDLKYPLMTAKAQRNWLNHMLKTIHKSHLNKFVTQRLISSSESERIIDELTAIMSQHPHGKDGH